MTQSYNLGVPGLGTTFSYCTSSGGTFVPVGQVKSIEPPELEINMAESTGLNSVADEALPTLLKSGESTFNVTWNGVDTTHAALLAFLIAKTLLYWKIGFPAPIGPGATGAAVTYSFPGYLCGFAISGVEEEGLAMAAYKLKPTGLPAIA